MLLNCYLYSFEQGFMPSFQRNGIITLLPKKDKEPLLVKKLQAYFSALIIYTDYKIIAKLMANCLK